MNFIESGSFGGKYHYVKLRFSASSDKTLVIFPPTQELLFPIRINPDLQIKRYLPLLPTDILGNVYILGYDENISIETFLADVAQDFGVFIRDNIGPCMIAGISYGGGVAIPFAALFPELTQKLLLVVSSYAMSEQGLAICNEVIDHTNNNKRLHAQLRLTTLFRSPLFKLYVNLITRLKWPKMKTYLNPPSTIVNAYTHLVKYNYGLAKYIHDIEAPSLIIGGTKDQFFSEELYQELHDAIKNSKLVLFKNATHAAPVENLSQTRELVHNFLKT